MLDVRYQEEDDYLFVFVRGSFNLKHIEGQIPKVVERANQLGRTRVLIDAFEVSPPQTNFQRHLVGVRIAEALPGHMRLAILIPAQQNTLMAESAAVERGAELKVTSDRDQALTWLLAPPSHRIESA